MDNSYAVLEFMDNFDEINIKYNILRKSPEFLFDWYIKKTNPFKMCTIEIFGFKGLLVKIPVLRQELENKQDDVMALTERTLLSLEEIGVPILLAPKEFRGAFPETIRVATGQSIFQFFIMEAIEKALFVRNASLKDAEILIIDGDRDVTLSVVDMVYPYVNFLSVITADKDEQVFNIKAQNIFEDNGLNLLISDKNKSVLEIADIIINTSSENNRYDFYYKRNAIYFELGHNKQKARELSGKRRDILMVDGIKLAIDKKFVNLDVFELVYYGRNREYQSYLRRGYAQERVANIKRHILRTGANLGCLTSLGKPVS